MKQLKQWMLAAILILCGMGVCQAQEEESYVSADLVPDGRYFLPAPPDSLSPTFTDDLIQWEWGKTQRDTKRGEKAIREQQNASNVMRGILAEVLELSEISNDKTPALSKLLEKCYNTGGLSTQNAKDYYMRSRPFMTDGPYRLPLLKCGQPYRTPFSVVDSSLERIKSSLVPIGRVM